MTERFRFRSGVLLLEFARCLPRSQFDQARFWEDESHWVIEVEGNGQSGNLNELAARYSGTLQEKAPAGSRKVWTPVALFDSAVLHSRRMPEHLPGDVFLLCLPETEEVHEYLADLLSRDPEVEVKVEVWDLAEHGTCMVFRLRPCGPWARLPAIRLPAVVLLHGVPNRPDHLIPLDSAHPLGALACRIVTPLPEGDLRVRIDFRRAWIRAKRISEPEPLCSLVRPQDLEVEDVTPSSRGRMADTPIPIPLEFTDDPEFRSNRDVSARIYVFDQTEDILPYQLLDLCDRAQAGLDEARFTYFRESRDRRGLPHRGAAHYVMVEGGAEPLHRVLADHVFEQPYDLSRMGLPLFLRSGARFRPDLVPLLHHTEDAAALVSSLKESLKIGTGDGPVLLWPGASPKQPRARRLSGGCPLSEVIQAILSEWNPELEGRIESALAIGSSEEAVLLHSELEQNLSAVHREMEEVATGNLAELAALEAQVAKAIGRAREWLSATQGIDQTLGSILAEAVGNWDEIATAVFSHHQEFLRRAQTWETQTREKLNASIQVGDFVQSAADKAVDAAEQNLQNLRGQKSALSQLREGLRDRVEILEGESDRLAMDTGELERDLANARTEAGKVLDGLKAAAKPLEDAAAQASAQKEDLSRELAELNRLRSAVDELRMEVRSKADAVALSRQGLKREKAALEREKEQLHREQSKLDAEGKQLDELRARIGPLEREVSSLSARVEALRPAVDRHAELTKEQAELDLRLENCRERERLIAQLLVENEKLAEDVEELDPHSPTSRARVLRLLREVSEVHGLLPIGGPRVTKSVARLRKALAAPNRRALAQRILDCLLRRRRP